MRMSQETIELMVQTCKLQMKNRRMPARLDTMAWAYNEICTGEDPWTALGNFTNAWYDYAKHMRVDLVSEPLTMPEQETEYTRHWAAFCAASVEFLCERYDVICPEWVHDLHYTLPEPWYGNNENLRKYNASIPEFTESI